MLNVSYYPGCSLEGTAREYAESIVAVSRILDIELTELEDWNCCGASSAHATSDELAFALPARNLLIADKAGKDLVIPCAACYSRLKTAEKKLKNGKKPAEMEANYQGSFQVKHFSSYLWEEVGEKPVREKIAKPLNGLKVVCYYGCLITRPPETTGAADPDNPESMDNLMEALGADVRPWSYKTDCCGGGHSLTLPEIARKLTQKLFDMAAEAGAEAIVTACPMCQSNLDSYQPEISREAGKEYRMPIFYFTELMGLAFGHPSAGKWLARHMVDPRPLLRQKGLLS
jgi:heterodisulfide reductase subunit B